MIQIGQYLADKLNTATGLSAKVKPLPLSPDQATSILPYPIWIKNLEMKDMS